MVKVLAKLPLAFWEKNGAVTLAIGFETIVINKLALVAPRKVG